MNWQENNNRMDNLDEETFEEQTGLQKYLDEINRHSLLSAEETLRLAALVKGKSDKEAIDKLIVSNLRLVVKIAMDFRKYWMEGFLDLVQEGNIGLARAVKKFDPDKEVKFSYYASFWIRAYIMKHIMENKRLIKIGTTQNQRKLFYKLEKEIRRLEMFGEKPDPAEIAANLDVDVEEVVEMTWRLNGSEVSLDAPLNFEEKNTLNDLLSCNGPTIEEIVTGIEEQNLVRDIVVRHESSFNEKEFAILDQRLLSVDSKTLKCVADQFDVSKERIRQIEVSLLGKLQAIFAREMPDRVAA
ncbi:MAG: sigma-70 family RNA polymerase sigma factor [Proteobacteria bacterium]|nr:sigma-70 family RNA polymerase sigma factor [Pseudomonadota bacterium]MBU1738154.1 sigma-70 family RNA polymerase sigma factor [Pseudomonadota bacterium]